MRPMLKFAALAGAVLVLSGPIVHAPVAAESEPCARPRQIDGFRYVDDKTVILEAGPGRKFKVTFRNTCRDLKFATSIGVDGPTSACLRSGDALVLSRDGVIPERCIISTIESVKAD